MMKCTYVGSVKNLKGENDIILKTKDVVSTAVPSGDGKLLLINGRTQHMKI